MNSSANTLGRFLADLMEKHNHNNSTLAAVAGVSESVIRNLLKHGIDPQAKDPDPRTLRRVADALDVDAIMLFRLAGYIPPQANANSVRADYLADVFDELPPEKQDAVLGVLEAMTDSYTRKEAIHAMREMPSNPLAGFDLNFPKLVRLIANQLIAHYQMEAPGEAKRIEPDVTVHGYRWKDLPPAVQQRVKALIEHKLSLEYDPTMVDPEWRD
ncbi:MAG: helix-turn-helix transcriptional regulator [Anaerolineae bacterium]|nr:helix-turn-helix transcriptional regulator [Anaerolineae bacterium]